MDLTVTDVPEQARYEIRSGERRLGWSEYRLEGDLLVIRHTEVEPGHEGEGVGSTLVREMLADARRRALRVKVRCPFVREYLQRHVEAAIGLVLVP